MDGELERKMMRLSLFPGRAEIGIATTIATEQPAATLLSGSSGVLSAELIQTGEFCAPIEGGPAIGNSGLLIVTGPAGKRLLAGCCQADAAAF